MDARQRHINTLWSLMNLMRVCQVTQQALLICSFQPSCDWLIICTVEEVCVHKLPCLSVSACMWQISIIHYSRQFFFWDFPHWVNTASHTPSLIFWQTQQKFASKLENMSLILEESSRRHPLEELSVQMMALVPQTKEVVVLINLLLHNSCRWHHLLQRNISV